MNTDAACDVANDSGPAENINSKVIPKETLNHQIQQNIPAHKNKKVKKVYSRVNIDPTKNYSTPESRESWGPNVKGKKFRKEKGKKKRTAAAGVKIDGAVKSIRFD